MRITTLLGAAALAGASLSAPAHAAGEADPLLERHWSFEGFFGSFDREAAQRGFQVYSAVCSGCHSMEYVAFRTLGDLGYSEDQVEAFAAQYTVVDGPNDEGEMYERAAVSSDYVPSPYPNEQASRAANGGAYPPNLSLITKARAQGPDYIYSLLQGYVEPPQTPEAEEKQAQGLYYNAYYPGHWIAMAQPIWGQDVEYADGTEATIEQQSYDLVNFLHWAAEPKLEERKRTGLAAMLVLIVLTALFYVSKRKVWSDLH